MFDPLSFITVRWNVLYSPQCIEPVGTRWWIRQLGFPNQSRWQWAKRRIFIRGYKSYYDTLSQSSLSNQFNLVVEYGAELSLKNSIIGGGYLHSHQHLYPEEFGPQQQQITSYNDKKDPNSIFIVKRTNQIQNERHFDDQLVRNGDFLWLQHNLTQRALHSHNYRAPLALNQFQVTGYGNVSILRMIWFCKETLNSSYKLLLNSLSFHEN